MWLSRARSSEVLRLSLDRLLCASVGIVRGARVTYLDQSRLKPRLIGVVSEPTEADLVYAHEV